VYATCMQGQCAYGQSYTQSLPSPAGTQAVFLSSGSFRRRFATYYKQRVDDNQGLQDKHVNSFVNSQQVPQFYPDKSLVQHIGASSSIFGGGKSNHKFHRADTFPFFEKYVTEDEAAEWI
jgi:hypothetical protein